MPNNNKDYLAIVKELLIGEQLSSVIFVQDYLQIGFDGQVFTAYVFPEVLLNSVIFTSKKEGYRDALCSLIAEIVTDILLIEGASLSIIFSNGKSLTFILAPDSTKYEKLVFTKLDKADFIWD